MRLQNLSHGHGLLRKLMFRFIRLVQGYGPPDVVRMLYYRPDYFGRPFSALIQQVLRGPSPWTVGERELFAAFVSRQNHCSF